MSKATLHIPAAQATPEDLAEAFADLCSDEQARFYNALAEIADPWLCFQLQAITTEDGLTDAGRRCMQYIGEYSHWGIHTQIKRRVVQGGTP